MPAGEETDGFHAVRLSGREDAGGGLVRLTIDPGDRVAASHTSIGQYVEVRIGPETGYFVLVNEPLDRPWHLIMRAGGGVSDVLLTASPGDWLEISGAIGKGFPLERARGRRLVVALGGTGVAAAIPLLRRRLTDRDERLTTVLIGVRNHDEIPLIRDLEAWSDAGVDVVVCLSQDRRNVVSKKVRFVHGYIQDALRKEVAAGPGHLRGALLFAVGHDSLIASLRELAPELGIRGEDVLTNH